MGIVGKECPYWKSGHKEAKLTYEGGRVVSIAGPHGEIYIVAGGSGGKGGKAPAPSTEPTKLFKQGFVGNYIIDGYENNKNSWHYVKITIVDAFKGIYKWTNRANKSWTLTMKQGSSDTLLLGKECPYWKSGFKEAKVTFEAGKVVAIVGPHGEVYKKTGGSGSGSGSGGKKSGGDSDKSTDDSSGDDSSDDDSSDDMDCAAAKKKQRSCMSAEEKAAADKKRREAKEEEERRRK